MHTAAHTLVVLPKTRQQHYVTAMVHELSHKMLCYSCLGLRVLFRFLLKLVDRRLPDTQAYKQNQPLDNLSLLLMMFLP